MKRQNPKPPPGDRAAGSLDFRRHEGARLPPRFHLQGEVWHSDIRGEVIVHLCVARLTFKRGNWDFASGHAGMVGTGPHSHPDEELDAGGLNRFRAWRQAA